MFRNYDNKNIGPVEQMDPLKETEIRAYLLGAVHCWSKNRFNEWFTLQDLFGGENRDWTDTPLIYFYERQIQNGLSVDASFAKAAQDAGNILKSVILYDVKEYDTIKNGYENRKYYWTGN